MLDPIACANVRTKPEPTISLSALLKLRGLLDAQSFLKTQISGTPELPNNSVHSGGNHETKKAATAGVSIIRRQSMRAPAGGKSEPLKEDSMSSPVGGSQKGSRREEKKR
jgi:hypothetical protein